MNRSNKLYAFAVSNEIDGPIAAIYLTNRHPMWFEVFQEWQGDIHGEDMVGSLDPWLFTLCFPLVDSLEDKRRLLKLDPKNLEILALFYHNTTTE